MFSGFFSTSQTSETQSLLAERKVQEELTQVTTTAIAIAQPSAVAELERLLEIEKKLKSSFKSPFFDNAVTAFLATISLLFIILELKAFFSAFSLDDNIPKANLDCDDNPVGTYYDGARYTTIFAIAYSLRTLKYSIDSVPDEIIGEIRQISHVDVSGWNKKRLFALVKTLVKEHEQCAMRHSEAHLYLALKSISAKLNSRLKTHEKIVDIIIKLLRSVGLFSLGVGYYVNEDNSHAMRGKALLAYLTSGLTFDLAYLIKLISYHVPQTEKVLDDTEIKLVHRFLRADSIHAFPANHPEEAIRALPADHVAHIVRRHSLCFFIQTPDQNAIPITQQVYRERRSRSM
jgi:hypothetical protein